MQYLEREILVISSIFKSFKSFFMTSLSLSHGLSVCCVPFSSAPCSRIRGILYKGILFTCPARRQINFSLAENGLQPVFLKTSSLVILSIQVLPNMDRRLKA